MNPDPNDCDSQNPGDVRIRGHKRHQARKHNDVNLIAATITDFQFDQVASQIKRALFLLADTLDYKERTFKFAISARGLARRVIMNREPIDGHAAIFVAEDKVTAPVYLLCLYKHSISFNWRKKETVAFANITCRR